MSTRFYFPSSGSMAADVSPAYTTTVWSNTTLARRDELMTYKPNSTYHVSSITDNASLQVNYLMRQFVSSPMASGTYINGYIRGVGFFSQNNSAENANRSLYVYVVNSAGTTVRGVLHSSVNSNNSSMLNVGRRSIFLPNSTTVASLTSQAGDRLVVEIGVYPRTSVASAYYVQAWFGTPSSDATFDETTTNSWAPWIEFNTNFEFPMKKVGLERMGITDNEFPHRDMTRSSAETVGLFEATRSNLSTLIKKIVVEMMSIITPGQTREYTLFNSAIPATDDAGADLAGSLGTKFYSDMAGTVTGIRFYKSALNTGIHYGHLWTEAGSMIASLTFSSETASGWQEARFASPIAINSGTVYMASYQASGGHYAYEHNYFSTQRDFPPLHCPANAGMYAYGLDPTLPNLTYLASNYYVEPIVSTTGTGIPWRMMKNRIVNEVVNLFTPGQAYQDDFNRADENPLAGNWTTTPKTLPVMITGGMIAPSTVQASTCGAYWSKGSFGPNQYSEVRILSAYIDSGPLLRISPVPSESTYYFLGIGPTTWYFGKRVLGTFTALGATQNRTTNSGTIVRFQIRGGTLQALFDGVPDPYTVVDSAIGSGYPGLGFYTNVARFDDWKGGTIDDTNRLMTMMRSTIEAIGITEKVNRILTTLASGILKITVEAVGITEKISRRMFMTRRSAEQVAIADKSTRRGFFTRRTAEPIGITEKTVRLKKMIRAIVNSMTIADKSTRRAFFTRRTAEPVGISDRSTRIKAMFRRTAEAVGITDKSLRQLATAIKKVTVEMMSIKEATAKKIATAIKKITVETIAITDRTVRQIFRALTKTIVDLVSIKDKSTRWLPNKIKKIIVEAIAIADRVSRIRGLIRGTKENLGIKDGGLASKIASTMDMAVKNTVRIYTAGAKSIEELAARTTREIQEGAQAATQVAGAAVRRFGAFVKNKIFKGGGGS